MNKIFYIENVLNIKEEILYKKKKNIPEIFIYEYVNGNPIFYKDYKKILEKIKKHKKLSEKMILDSMGSGYQQWKIIDLILEFLYKNINTKKYRIATNEAGFQINKNHWRSLDIAIFEKSALKIYDLQSFNGYIDIPPLIVIEVDTKADLESFDGTFDYIKQKTEDLLNANVQKVIWYTTNDERVLIAESEKDWILSRWDKDIMILDQTILNLTKLIQNNK